MKQSPALLSTKLATTVGAFLATLGGVGYVAFTIWVATQQYLSTFPAFSQTASGMAAVLVGVSVGFSVFSETRFKSKKYFPAIIAALIVAGTGAFSIHAIINGKTHIKTESAKSSADSDELYKGYIAAIAANQKKAADLNDAVIAAQSALNAEESAHQKALAGCVNSESKKQNKCEAEENAQFSKNKKLRDERIETIKRMSVDAAQAADDAKSAKLSAENRRVLLDTEIKKSGQVGMMEIVVSVLPDLLLPVLSFSLSFFANAITLIAKDLDSYRQLTNNDRQRQTATEQRQNRVTVDTTIGRDGRLAALERAIRDGILDSGDGFYISISDASKQAGFYKNRHPVRDLFNKLVDDGVLERSGNRYKYADGVKKPPKIIYVDFKRGAENA